jgi:hypothetical protein
MYEREQMVGGAMNHEVLLLSGGAGAGKTTLALKLRTPGAAERIAFADELRATCAQQWPGVPWFDRRGEEKSKPRPELGGLSIREMLVREGELRCREDLNFWADKLACAIEGMFIAGVRMVIVDDLRKLSELGRILKWCRNHGWVCTHLHLEGGVPDYDCAELAKLADYVVVRRAGLETFNSSQVG